MLLHYLAAARAAHQSQQLVVADLRQSLMAEQTSHAVNNQQHKAKIAQLEEEIQVSSIAVNAKHAHACAA